MSGSCLLTLTFDSRCLLPWNECQIVVPLAMHASNELVDDRYLYGMQFYVLGLYQMEIDTRGLTLFGQIHAVDNGNDI